MNINNISNTYKMSSPYSVILCDLWGVVHNGKEIFQKSRDFLKRVKDDGKKVVLPVFFLDDFDDDGKIVKRNAYWNGQLLK